MSLILDYIAFEARGEPTVKEVAIVSTCGTRCGHFVLKAPTPWSTLDAATKLAYTDEIKNKHGICWDDGVVQYSDLDSYIRRLAARAVALYAFGEEKCKTFEKMLNRKVINIEKEFNAPHPDLTALAGASCLLPCHGVPSMQCAYRNADRMRKWLQYYSNRVNIANFCCEGVGGGSGASTGSQLGQDVGDPCKCMHKV